MKILIITNLFPPAVGGAATYFGILARDLSKEASVERVYVLTEMVGGHKLVSREGKIVLLRLLPPRDSISKLPFIIHATTFMIVQAVLTIVVLALSSITDIIHIHGKLINRYTSFLFRLIHLPVVIDIRDNLYNFHQIKRLPALLCASENIFHSLAGRIPKPRLHLIPVPFEPPLQTQNTQLSPKKDAGITLLFAGSLTDRKGVPELTQSCIRLNELGHSLRLFLAGTNQLGERFMSTLPDFIRYLGPLPQEQLWRLMQEVDIIILPSKSEGMPRVCLEAFSFGKRVLCPPGVPEFQRECPETVIPSIDPDTISNKVLECLQWKNIPTYPLEYHYVGKCLTATKAVYEGLLHQ